MSIATALVSGHTARPELAGEAVARAMAKAGLERAASILLFLGRDFARHPEAAVREAARTGACLNVGGGCFGGVVTEDGWSLDGPVAAAMVFGSNGNGDAPQLSLTPTPGLPQAWRSDRRRAGLIGCEAAWQSGRVQTQADLALPAASARHVLSTGLKPLGELSVDAAASFDLHACAGQRAADAVRRLLPPEWREQPPWHLVAALRDDEPVPVAVLTACADGSLTMADRFQPGERLTWAIRQPLGSEEDMRRTLNPAVDAQKRPDFAFFLSCIGRGPLFYGDDDRDLAVFRAAFPGVPLLGAYGNGQIVPGQPENRLYNNSVLTLLCEMPHVQSQP